MSADKEGPEHSKDCYRTDKYLESERDVAERERNERTTEMVTGL